MKKVIIFLVVLCGQIIFSQVNTRLVYVSNTRNVPSAGLSTLVFDVEAISTAGNVQINNFQDAIQLDATFRAQNPSVSFSNELFATPNYNPTTIPIYRASDGRVRYVYTFNSGTRGTINTTYTRILTISIQYTTGSVDGNISWFAGIPRLPAWNVADLNNTIITGAELGIPAQLSSIPLPVELTSFTSKLLDDKVQLNWITKTEVNNYGFNVERRINEGEWNSIGFVEGHGNSNSPKEYSQSDKDLFAGGSKFQYRLKQADNDGQFEYSDIVEVEIVPTQFELSQNYPNPVIEFSLPQNVNNVRLSIYNALGEKVAELVNKELAAGKYSFQWNAQNVATGMYIYELRTDKFVSVK